MTHIVEAQKVWYFHKLTCAIYANPDLNPVPDVCLRLRPTWLGCGFSLVPTVCMLRALFIVSSQFVN